MVQRFSVLPRTLQNVESQHQPRKRFHQRPTFLLFVFRPSNGDAYSRWSRPDLCSLQVSEDPLPPLPSGVTVLAGDPGDDCVAVCGEVHGVCVPEAFSSLQSCNALRSHFICEAGCGERKDDDIDEPYYIIEETHKRNLPAFCVVQKPKPGGSGEYDCAWRDEDKQRICPCLLSH